MVILSGLWRAFNRPNAMIKVPGTRAGLEAIDRRLHALRTPQAHGLLGRTAIAAAQLAYEKYKEWTAGERWRRLTLRGARSQRLLWASTSTKDPTYADIKYVEALIGPQTVNTLPRATLEAYRDHGHPALRLQQDLEAARTVWSGLKGLGIDLEEVSDELEREGVQKFIEPFDELQTILGRRARTPECP